MGMKTTTSTTSWCWTTIFILFFTQSAYTHNISITASSTTPHTHHGTTTNTAGSSTVSVLSSTNSVRPNTNKFDQQHLIPRIVPASPTMSQVEVGGAGFRLISPPNLAGSSPRPIVVSVPQVQRHVVTLKPSPSQPVKATAGYAGGQLWTITPDRTPVVEATAPKGMVYNYIQIPMFPTHFPLFTTPVVAYSNMVPEISLPPSSPSSQPYQTSSPSGSSSSEIHLRPSEDRSPWLRRVGRLMSQNLFGQLVQGVLRLQRRHLQQQQPQQQPQQQHNNEELQVVQRHPRTQHHHHQHMDHSSSEVVGSWVPPITYSHRNKYRHSMIPHFDDESSEILTSPSQWGPEVRVRVGRPLRLTTAWNDLGERQRSRSKSKVKNLKRGDERRDNERKDDEKEKDSNTNSSYYSRFFSFARG